MKNARVVVVAALMAAAVGSVPAAERAPATSDIRWDTTVVTPSPRIVTP